MGRTDIWPGMESRDILTHDFRYRSGQENAMLCLRQGIVMATALCVLMLSVPAQADATAITVIMAYRPQYKYNFSNPIPRYRNSYPGYEQMQRQQERLYNSQQRLQREQERSCRQFDRSRHYMRGGRYHY
ncbi:hypothetical protein NB646_06810 [Oxalobacter aliiformigenes]|uniref:Uncharacterized protein n=2 Tax=Oxalobacter aliiformigenes TaxID=2946593 RepID=A0A9E9LA72_9BURK|nr:hypothetical protein [Oxalobacter aliiformigenes]WAV90577.1 hypothetical protein NB646_06810 [Oxalobacter aliiformigenes]